ncbi:EF-hand domain-containing protein [Paucibacter sp. Y2R2-4]|uniref:EF-hand domain-containing protein n=1 Tax=Paucibacter sp. Y2R2-4 TaxID=2893553 RepID=UPI0021E49A52|nr:EF-hand domain-containing protein [Paucibacter sp. Y2R2-4]MCV2351563.1 EF-hand domain-containing protein [Paucibacter sp. Y2R2-4]
MIASTSNSSSSNPPYALANEQARTSRSRAGPSDAQAEDLFKQMDSGGKGYVTATDAQAFMVKISAQGARLAEASSEQQQEAQQKFSQADSNGDGQLSLSEFKQGLAQRPPPPAGAGPAHGKPDGGGDGGGDGGPHTAGRPSGAARGAPPAPAAGAATSGSSNSGKSYEAADANQDGKVSEPERQAYALKHPKQDQLQAPTQTQAALQSYREVAELA